MKNQKIIAIAYGIILIFSQTNAAFSLENKINDVSARVNKWWVDYKKKLKNHISKIIHV